MRVAIHTPQKARIAFVQSWPLLVYSLVGTFPKPFETGGAGAAVLRPYGLSFPVVCVKPPHGLNRGSAHETIFPKVEYLPCSLREIFVTLGDGQKWSKVCK